jgi:hypothetical protein
MRFSIRSRMELTASVMISPALRAAQTLGQTDGYVGGRRRSGLPEKERRLVRTAGAQM